MSDREPAVYKDRDRRFSCLLSGDWRVWEPQGPSHRVSFIKPAARPGPGPSVVIAVYHYGPSSSFGSLDGYRSAQSLAAQKTDPTVSRPWKGRTVTVLGSESDGLREETTLIPLKAGFLAAVYTAPAADFAASLPEYRRFLENLEVSPDEN